jgi:hypothetical protein
MDYTIEGYDNPTDRGRTSLDTSVGLPITAVYPDGTIGTYGNWGGTPGGDILLRSEWMRSKKTIVACNEDRPSRNFIFADNFVEHWSVRRLKGSWDCLPVSHWSNPFTWKLLVPSDPSWKLYLYGFHHTAIDPLSVLLPKAPDDLLHDLYQKALRTFMAQMPEEVEGLNFLYELRQLGELIPRLADSIGQTIASGYLNWNFGWAPFLSDLQKVAGIVDTVQKRLKWLRDTWGKKVRLSFVRKDFFQPPFLPLSQEMDPEPFHVTISRKSFRYTFRAQAWLTHHLEDLDSKLTALRALAISLGVGSPLKAIWASLPFSFILDWLAGVSSVLDGLSIDHITSGDFWVRRPTTSVLMVGTLSVAQYTQRDSYVSPPFDWIFPVYRGDLAVRRFQRWQGPPVTFDYTSMLSGLSAKQASLLLAISAGTRY